jgi:hypothetical protein
MVSCGYEPTAVIDGFGSLKGIWGMIRGTFSMYKDEHALRLLSEPAPHGPATLIQIEKPAQVFEETNA